MKIPLSLTRSYAVLPAYQTAGSAALDLSAALEEPLVIKPMERCVVPTGIAIALPIGYEAQVRARSGLSLKHGITMANGVGTIDSDYRGEIGAIIINLGSEAFTITPGMRIAQLVVARCEHVTWDEVTILPESDRRSGGYGSTGH